MPGRLFWTALLALFLAGAAFAVPAALAAPKDGGKGSAQAAKAVPAEVAVSTPKGGGKGAAAAASTPAQGEAKEKAAKTAAPGRKAQVTDVQVYSGRDYSRIVMILSGEAQHRWQLLPPGGEGGRLLYVDVDNVSIRPGVPGRFDVRGLPARKVRLGYFKPDTARMVVEVENLQAHNVFVLQNPYRVIVDVHAEASRKAAPEAGPKRDGTDGQKASRAGTPQAKGRAKGPDSGEAAGARVAGASGGNPVMGLALRSEKAGTGKAVPGSAGGEKVPPGAVKAGAEKPGHPGIRLDSPGKRRMAGRLAEQLGLTVRSVMIDPGHGGRDSGARGAHGLWEKNITLRLARILGARLEKMGLEVMYTRTTDKYVPLEVRTAMANARKADLFISVHCNAHGSSESSGLETYSLNLASTPEQVRVAARENAVDPHGMSDMRKILDELLHASKLAESRDFAKAAHQGTLAQARRTLDLRDRGVHEAPFYVLLGATMPAILVEVGYITNPAEAARLRDDKYLASLAEGIAQGVKAYRERLERFARN